MEEKVWNLDNIIEQMETNDPFIIVVGMMTTAVTRSLLQN